MFLYTVYDKVAQEHGPSFEAKNDEVAIRNVRDLIKNQRMDWRDYDLCCHAEIKRFDEELTVEPVSRLVNVPVEVPDGQ